MQNKNRRHAEFISTSSRYDNNQTLKQVQGDNSIKVEALNNDAFRATLRFGFTLIELLVVVLIVGVLAAVALPQYKRAVLKSRFSTLMLLAKNVWDSNEVFYLSNGGYAAGVDELDVSVPADPKIQVEVKNEDTHQYVQVSKTKLPARITMYQTESPNFAGETHCEALLNDELANWLCQDSLQGTFVGNKFGYAIYSLSPQSTGSLGRMYYNDGGPFADGDVCVGSRHFTGCNNNNFTNESVCVAKSNVASACNGSTFDHSYCIGSGYWSSDTCRGHFQNHSVCYAVGNHNCDNADYDETSCCTGGGCKVEADTCAYKNITPPPAPSYDQY